MAWHGAMEGGRRTLLPSSPAGVCCKVRPKVIAQQTARALDTTWDLAGAASSSLGVGEGLEQRKGSL